MDLMSTAVTRNITGGVTLSSSSGSSAGGGAGGDGVWIVVDEGDLKGMTMVTDRQTGDVIGLSSRNCSNGDKRRDMPPLDEYPELKVVDFHGQRYMKSIDESIGVPAKMERLILTRMDSLTTLHPAVGNLHNLVEVRTYLWSPGEIVRLRFDGEISSLPCSRCSTAVHLFYVLFMNPRIILTFVSF